MFQRERERKTREKKSYIYLILETNHNTIILHFDNNIHGTDDNRSHDVCASGEHTGYIDKNACGPKSPT